MNADSGRERDEGLIRMGIMLWNYVAFTRRIMDNIVINLS